MNAPSRKMSASDDVSNHVDWQSVEPVSEDLEALWRLGSDAVRRHWRSLVGRPMPRGLGRGITLRILTYHAQVQRHGGLDRASQRALDEIARQEPRDGFAASQATKTLVVEGQSANIVRSSHRLRPGTLLSREHAGILHKVLVLDDGFGWNEQTFDSLSKVALAITGTRWNGPRFFGLRGKPFTEAKGKNVTGDGPRVVTGRGRAARKRAATAQGALR